MTLAVNVRTNGVTSWFPFIDINAVTSVRSSNELVPAVHFLAEDLPVSENQ